MKIAELREAVLKMRDMSVRHGATEEASALAGLARVAEPFAEKSVAEFVKMAVRKKSRTAKRRRR